MVVTGITGDGKSSACNFLLGEKIFEVGLGLKAVTSKSASHSTTLNSRKVEIIDTPGFCEDDVDEEQSIKELGKAVILARNGVHAFALVINVSHRFTSSQVTFLKQMKLFDELWPFMFVIFSAAKSYGDTDEEQRKMVYDTHDSPQCLKELKTLLDRIGKRFIMLESTESSQIYRDKKVSEFLEMVDSIIHTNKKVYSNKLFEKAIKLYEKERGKEKNREKEYETMTIQLNAEIKGLQAEKERQLRKAKGNVGGPTIPQDVHVAPVHPIYNNFPGQEGMQAAVMALRAGEEQQTEIYQYFHETRFASDSSGPSQVGGGISFECNLS